MLVSFYAKLSKYTSAELRKIFLGNKIHTGLSLTESTGGLGTGFSGGRDFFLENKISLSKISSKTRFTI